MTPSRRAGSVAALLILALLMSTPIHAWGEHGHRIVARIAAKNLLQTTRDKLRAIFGVSNQALDDAMARASIWPDLLDRTATRTDKWHYVNVPIAPPFSLAGLCVADECVVGQIDNMQKRLRDNLTGFKLKASPPPHLARPMTSQELAFLIHFVGDLHQPLHAAVNGDRGGGCVDLTKALIHPGTTIKDTTNLHMTWDVDEVLVAMKPHGSERATANALFERFKQGAAVTQATPAEWARESHDLAKSVVYQKLKIPNHSAAAGDCAFGIKPVTITDAYLTGNIAVVEQRLMQAGIRLSNVLNEICKGTGCKQNP